MSAFLQACRGESTSYTPIWLMRQAGRYQPEYRAIRSKVSFVELCQRSDLAAEVTLLPVSQLGVDAAILFADILLILGAPRHRLRVQGGRAAHREAGAHRG
ncbi:MAG: uroporphyrinogen decarboxylase family protein [Myxococcales bacterium]